MIRRLIWSSCCLLAALLAFGMAAAYLAARDWLMAIVWLFFTLITAAAAVIAVVPAVQEIDRP